MKIIHQVEIAVSRARVIELFDDRTNQSRWQPDFISIEPVSGVPGQPGATSRLRYKMGKREISMIETLTVRNIPYEISGTYDAKGIHTSVRNTFDEKSPDSTLWTAEQQFRLSSLMLRVMAVLMPGMFRKQLVTNMEQFKQFAENGA